MPGVGTTHHLKLGNEFLIVRPNSYMKRPAPTFGARYSSGDPDYNNLSIWQHWVQKCWVGGMGADEWVDDAMFKDAAGIDSTVHEKVTLSRLLKRGTGANWALGGATGIFKNEFLIYNNILYCMQFVTAAIGRLYAYTVSTQAWASVTVPTGLIVRSMGTFDGKFFIGGSNAGSKLYYATSPGTWNLVTNPAGVADAVRCMIAYNTKLYVAFGSLVWRMKADLTWDGSTVFYTANSNSASNYISDMEVHLGTLYMLSQNGHLHKSDGNNTFDIWSWDGNTSGVSLRSYDGKLFVGTYEFTDTADIGYGVLYQFTGGAVTELKRWGRAGKATTIGQMITYARKMYYGASGLFGVRGGFGVAVYDAVEDSHSIYAVQDDTATYTDASGVGTDWVVDDVIVFGGKLFCAVRGWGVFFTESSFKDVELNLAGFTTSTTGGILNSSLYDGGTPGLEKLWNRIIVFAELPAAAQSMTVAYSTDGGATFTSLATQVGPSPASGQYVFNLNNIRSTRFQYRITLKTTDTTKSPTVRGVVVAYLPQPEPNWMWTFTIPVTDKWVLIDNTVETKTTNTLIAYLEGLYRGQAITTFIDIDGVQWATNGPGVIVYDIAIVHYDIEVGREADVRITLLETVETY